MNAELRRLLERKTVYLDQGPGLLRLRGKQPTASHPRDSALDLRIIKFLKNSSYAYGNQVAIGVKARTALVLERLRGLAAQGLVDSVRGSRGSNGSLGGRLDLSVPAVPEPISLFAACATPSQFERFCD